MTISNYEKARDLAFGMDEGPITPARRRNMSDWLSAHLLNLTNGMAALFDHIDTLEAEKAGLTIRAQRAEAAETEVYDHTMGDFDREGRYDGDLLARLFFEPMVDSKKRWKVDVSEWRMRTYTERGHREGYKDSAGWYEAASILCGFETKSFRTSGRALDYLGRVRASADAGHMRRRLQQVSNGQNTQVA